MKNMKNMKNMNFKALKIVIVSTYPKEGSQNIGDQLITNALIAAIQDVNPNTSFEIVFRADDWREIKNKILNADHVFFACLAIRKRMDKIEYPWLSQVIDSEVPFSCIAAGTDLPVNMDENIYADITESTQSLLTQINNKAVSFTTRGVLSQFLCETLGLNQSKFNGDIAFYNTKYSKNKFVSDQDIKNIVISDPHRPKAYLNSIKVLVGGLKILFPNATIVLAQHGINPIVEEYCKAENIESIRIYEKPNSGLDIYDNADLHVGYRVHAHVSALTRRKYSYLLEQDGRGCDYGLTINKKISIPNYIDSPNISIPNDFLQKVYTRVRKSPVASISPAYQILALIKADKSMGFNKFVGLEKQIESFNNASVLSIKKSLSFN